MSTTELKKKNHLSVSNAVLSDVLWGSDFQILDKHPSLSVSGDKYGSFVTDLFSDDNNSLFLFPEQTIRRRSDRFMWKVKEIKSASLFAVSRHNVLGLFFLLFGCSPPLPLPAYFLSFSGAYLVEVRQCVLHCGSILVGKSVRVRVHDGTLWWRVTAVGRHQAYPAPLHGKPRGEEKCTTIGCLRLLPRGLFSLISSRALPARLTTANV